MHYPSYLGKDINLNQNSNSKRNNKPSHKLNSKLVYCFVISVGGKSITPDKFLPYVTTKLTSNKEGGVGGGGGNIKYNIKPNSEPNDT